MIRPITHTPEDDIHGMLKAELVAAAQRVYDDWHQDEDGYDEVVGPGGICNLIADEFMEFAMGLGFETAQYTDWDACHTWCIVEVSGKWYNFDIPYQTYEVRHGPSTFSKVENVELLTDDVQVWDATQEQVDWATDPENDIIWLYEGERSEA